MPRIISLDAAAAAPCSLEQCAAALEDHRFDPRDEDSLAHAAGWLGRLGSNPDFLGDILIAQLAARHCAEPVAQGYSPQVVVLTPPGAGAFLRANIWPGESDTLVRSSGTSPFLYGLPHDHNFSFLTYGYFGPGYWSDYFEYEYEDVAGWTGELAHLRHTGRRRLESGTTMLYRAHRDVHLQLPADSLSVSLNVMHADPATHWLDQYSFDVERGTISGIVSDGPSEAFLRVAVGMGSAEALDLAERFAARHPSDRMRLCASDALAAAAIDIAARDQVWAKAERSGSKLVAMEARLRRVELADYSTPPASASIAA
ncbi:MAG: transposase [Pseudomonadota bacterium]